jgi:hypothetical protein
VVLLVQAVAALAVMTKAVTARLVVTQPQTLAPVVVAVTVTTWLLAVAALEL